MADYRRHLAGRLSYAFLVRLPLEKDLAAGTPDGAFVRDTWLRDHLHTLVDRALLPGLLARCLDASHDEPFDPAEHERAADLGRLFIDIELERDEARKQADERVPKPKPPRIRDDWLRVTRRTAGAIGHRVRRATHRR
jgi:hypothetical protein